VPRPSDVRRWLLRLANALRPGRGEEELARELASHLALLEDEYVRRGLGREQARDAARRAFQGVEQVKELQRDARSLVWLDDMRRDFRYALRTLRRAPGFAATVVLLLALGIGANTAIFSVISGVVLKPLSYPEPDRIVAVLNRWTDTGRTIANLTGADEMDLSAQRGAFSAFAYYHGGEIGVQLADSAEFAGTQLVQPEFFDVFALAPVAGRLFNPDDAHRSAIVGAGFAGRSFGGAAAALGRSVLVDGRPYEIVGVMPAQMRFPEGTDVWLASSVEPHNRNRSGHNYNVVARLAPGVSVESANAQLAALAARLALAFPETNARKAFVVAPLRDTMVGRVRPTLLVLMAAVAVVLLIACANGANLILARAASRSREVAVRTALGAGRRHIVGQLLAESLVLACVAGGFGLLIARLGTDALLRAGASQVALPRLDDVGTDWRVLAFTALLSLLTAVGFGLVPALQAWRANASAALHGGGARGTLGGVSSRLRGGLVVLQIALSCALAVDAGLLLRSFASLTDAPLGFRSEGILVAYAHAPARPDAEDAAELDAFLRVGRLFDELFARLRGVPGVVAAAGAVGLPTGRYDSNGSYVVEGRQTFGGDFRKLPYAGFRLASPGYFRTLGIPLISGREFSEDDVYERPQVAIVSESLARQSFGAEDPIGHRIMCGLDRPDTWMTIVGVVGDVRQASPAAQPGPELYMPLRQHPKMANEVQVVVRSGGRPESLIPQVRQTVRALSPDVALKFTTLEASVGDSIAAPRFRLTLIALFAALALVLAAGGVYGMTSYVTSQRTSEFGLRMALGARAPDVVASVLRDATRLGALGIALGMLLALASRSVIATMVFGIQPLDPGTYAGVLLVALPLVVLAAVVPALRAARVDPMVALRES
jgi:predicted permease